MDAEQDRKKELANSRSAFQIYAEVLRINHWFKNVFVVLGSVASLSFFDLPLDWMFFKNSFLVLVASCFLSSVNYIINGIVDKPFDAKHPRKMYRAIPQGLLNIKNLYGLAGLVLMGTLVISTLVLNKYCTAILFVFFLAGIIYNIPPMRSKDLPYLDVVSEAANNPIRLMLGWFAVAPGQSAPPLSLIFLFWCFGCFLMTAKRYSEFRFLKDDSVGYRITFKYYSERSLYLAMILYTVATLILFFYFSWYFHPVLLYSLPGVIIFIVWFLKITDEEDSIVKEPERIYRNKAFFAYSIVLALVLLGLSI